MDAFREAVGKELKKIQELCRALSALSNAQKREGDIDVFREAVKKIERLGPDLMNTVCISPWIVKFQNLPREEQRPYYKIPILESGGKDGVKQIVMIFWAPNFLKLCNGTRPHSHGGSSARVRVLRGMLRQDVFSIDIDEAGRRHITSVGNYYTDSSPRKRNREFVEEPGSIHAVSNLGLGHWSVSLHEFDEGFTMEIYDFEKNLRWPSRGDEDTLGDPPENAVPIWDE